MSNHLHNGKMFLFLMNNIVFRMEIWLVYKRHFRQYFSYILAVSFIGGGSRSTLRKPPTCRK
jgi:hypothetical protein